MRDSVLINEKEYKMIANALTPIHYRDWTGCDLIQEFYRLRSAKGPTTDAYGMGLRLAYTMIRQADPDMPYTTYTEWAESFDEFPTELIGAAQDLYARSTYTSSQPKKKAK